MPKTLGNIVDNISRLPVLPEIVMRLLQMLDDPDVSIKEVEQVMSKDPSLGAQILRLVNSAFYGLPNRIADISRAITILGFREVKNLIIANSVSGAFRGFKIVRDFSLQDFWKHSLVTACVTRFLARKIHCAGGGDAFSIGLLHDIGKLILVNGAPEEAKKVLNLAVEKEIPFIEAENEILETNHQELGAWLMEKWNFPSFVVDIIKSHHIREKFETEQIIGCCYFGNYVSALKKARCSGSVEPVRLSAKAWQMLGMQRDDLKTMILLADQEIKRAKGLLEAILRNAQT